MVDRACTKCRAIADGQSCPLCSGTDLTKTWEGAILVFNPETSEVAKAIGAKAPGKYALKIK
ncbi:DNA-directed RNA polymerase subunit E'' [Candidatus Micrarchaeota archaeon]|nr:DNA-directed RNA polymerase subunit E'' [Candidatus Micrarchaeota archaeon]